MHFLLFPFFVFPFLHTASLLNFIPSAIHSPRPSILLNLYPCLMSISVSFFKYIYPDTKHLFLCYIGSYILYRESVCHYIDVGTELVRLIRHVQMQLGVTHPVPVFLQIIDYHKYIKINKL